MKTLGWIAIIFLVIILYFQLQPKRVSSGLNPAPTSSFASESGNDDALKLIRKEPKVFEAIITDANVLYVSVKDDGTRRDGYAAYLCEILRETRASVKTVKVVKVNSTNDPNKDNAYGVLLGQASW